MTEVKKCILCGMCKTSCPIYQVLLKETVSPRGKSKLAREDLLTQLFFACNLCKACTVACPLDLKLCDDFIKVREKINKSKQETEANKKMIENIRKYGNPFGEIEKGKTPKDLYCC